MTLTVKAAWSEPWIEIYQYNLIGGDLPERQASITGDWSTLPRPSTRPQPQPKNLGKSTLRSQIDGARASTDSAVQKQMPELNRCVNCQAFKVKPIPQAGLHTPFLLSIMRAMSHTTYDPRTPPALCHRPGHRSVFRIRQGTHSGRTSVEAFLRNPFHVPARRTSHTVIR